MSYGQQKPWSGMYMQHSTYSHDFSQLGISPRQRPGDNVYNASVRADIPAGTYRPTMYDQMESPRREDAQQRYDYRGDLTERRIPKRGTEWIGGRRYDNEPREGRHDMYERQRRFDMSPERMFNREFEIGIPYKERPLETLPYATNIRRRQTFTQGDAPRFNQNFNRKPKDAFDPECSEEFDLDAPYMYRERQYDSLPYINPQRRFLVNQDYNYNYGRHTSIGQEASRDYGQVAPHRSKQPEPLPPLDAKQNKHWMIHDDDIDKTQNQNNSPRNLDPYSFGRYTSVGQYDRGRNGSPERIDRGRNGSPERERKFEQVREPNDRHNRYEYPRETARDKYDERYEKPRDQIMDGYANHKMSDRTTQKDYGEFMLEKIKQDELRRNLDYPRQEAKKLELDDSENEHDHLPARFVPAAQSGGVYLFIRTDKGALTEIRKALQEGRSVLANSGGQLKGIAHSEQIQILEGRLNEWNVKPSLDPNKEWDVLNIVAVFWFPTKYHTQQWLDSSHFKDLTFPFPYGADMSVAPINFIPKEGDIYGTTFLVSEYRDVTDVDAFREKFIKPLRGIFKRLRIPDFVMNTIGADNFNRRAWMRKKSVVTVNRFEDSVAATNFFFDPEYVTLRTQLNDLIRWRTTVLFNLVEKPV